MTLGAGISCWSRRVRAVGCAILLLGSSNFIPCFDNVAVFD